MIKLKTKSLFNIITIMVLLLALFYVLIAIKKNNLNSYYSNNVTTVNGYINDFEIDGDKLVMEIIAKEHILVNYYIKSYEELKAIKNTYGLGDEIKIDGVLQKPNNNTVFNLFNYRHYLLSQKIVWIMQASNIVLVKKNNNLLYNLKNNFIKRIEKINYNKEYLYAFILGDSHYFEEDIMTSYRSNGITHLFAVSGMHVILVVTILKKFFNLIIKSPIIVLLIIILFLFLYTFLTGFSPSILRAVILYVIFTVNNMSNYKINKITLFLLVFGLFLLYNPYFVYNLGFLLSFTVCFYLLLFQRYINHFKNFFFKLLVTSTIAFLASMPIIMFNFFEVNILTPILNLVFVPLVSFIIFPLTLGTFFFPFLNSILTIILNIFEWLSLFFNNISLFTYVMAKPSIYIIILYYVIISLGLWQLTKKRFNIIGLLILMMFGHYHFNYFIINPNITFIDVGQGDSTLINMPYYNGNILIDTGGIINYNKEKWQQRKKTYSIAISTIIPYLKSLGIRKIDYLLLTHGDNDHIGEAINLINNFPISHIIFNSGNNNALEQQVIKVMKNKNITYAFYSQNILNLKNYSLKFLNAKNLVDENHDSLIIQANIANKNILLMGDATKEEEKKIIKVYSLTKMDILKVGHHGSNTSTDDTFIRCIKPAFAIISAGRNNRFHHPHQETLDTLNKYDIKTYITSVNGSIKIILKKELAIYTCM